MATLTNNALRPDGTPVPPGQVLGDTATGDDLYEVGVNVVDAFGNVGVVLIGPGQSITATLATPIPAQTQALIASGRLVVS